MSTTETPENHGPAPLLELGSSDVLGPLPLWRDDAGRSWWGADELTGEALLAWRDAAVAAERERRLMIADEIAKAWPEGQQTASMIREGVTELAGHVAADVAATLAAERERWKAHADAMAQTLEAFEAQGSDKTAALRAYRAFRA
jgi:DNA-binding helix-hairpin-helix protein with protein kinase domain